MQGSKYSKPRRLLGRGRVARPTLGHLYPRGKPSVLIYRRQSGPQDQSGHEGVKKNLYPSDTRAIHPIAKRHVSESKCAYYTHTHTHTHIYIYMTSQIWR